MNPCFVRPLTGVEEVQRQMWQRVLTYSVVGTQWVEGVGPTQKQASLSAEQHFDEVTTLILWMKVKIWVLNASSKMLEKKIITNTVYSKKLIMQKCSVKSSF